MLITAAGRLMMALQMPIYASAATQTAQTNIVATAAAAAQSHTAETDATAAATQRSAARMFVLVMAGRFRGTRERTAPRTGRGQCLGFAQPRMERRMKVRSTHLRWVVRGGHSRSWKMEKLFCEFSGK